MKKIFLPLISLSFLAACATPEQLAQQQAMQQEADTNTCLGYGLRPGSEAFGNCRLQLDLARQYYYDTPRYYGGYGYYGPRVGSSVYISR